MPRSIWGWLILAIIVIIVVNNPAGAGAFLHHTATSLTAFASSLGHG